MVTNGFLSMLSLSLSHTHSVFLLFVKLSQQRGWWSDLQKMHLLVTIKNIIVFQLDSKPKFLIETNGINEFLSVD